MFYSYFIYFFLSSIFLCLYTVQFIYFHCVRTHSRRSQLKVLDYDLYCVSHLCLAGAHGEFGSSWSG